MKKEERVKRKENDDVVYRCVNIYINVLDFNVDRQTDVKCLFRTVRKVVGNPNLCLDAAD
jgi:predicted solute-binding protein